MVQNEKINVCHMQERIRDLTVSMLVTERNYLHICLTTMQKRQLNLRFLFKQPMETYKKTILSDLKFQDWGDTIIGTQFYPYCHVRFSKEWWKAPWKEDKND